MKRYNVDPEYAVTIERLIDSLGVRDRVHILERVEYAEMVDFYRTGSIMLSVPESDGTPMSLLEAMACGCIPIVSDLPSLREWIVDGVNGRLVPVGDIDALARAMLEMADLEPRAELVARNLALVRDRASQQASRSAMLARYRELLSA
jgi:glycosyltransferase involved in cell wall biosynthesis